MKNTSHALLAYRTTADDIALAMTAGNESVGCHKHPTEVLLLCPGNFKCILHFKLFYIRTVPFSVMHPFLWLTPHQASSSVSPAAWISPASVSPAVWISPAARA